MGNIIMSNDINGFETFKISQEEKKRFFNFALKCYVNNDRNLGFCSLFQEYFNFEMNLIEPLSELEKYRPKKVFYNYKGEKTDEKSQFWFPLKIDDNIDKIRIGICEKILVELC